MLFFIYLIPGALYSNRNPFNFHTDKKVHQTKISHHIPQLVGIISCQKRYGALIIVEKENHIVFQGDQIKGYTIQDIFDRGITISRGKKNKQLILDEGIQ